MNFYKKLLIVFLALGMTVSCDLDEQLEDPLALTPEQASLEELYNSVQLSFSYLYEDVEYEPGIMARMYNGNAGFTYRAETTPESFNGAWGNLYSGLLPDVRGLQILDENQGNVFPIHVGTARVMEAYGLMAMVDLMGDIPYSEALQGTDVISPNVDAGADVYAAAIAILDEAIALLGTPDAPKPANDNIYAGDAAKWITAANTLKMRAALNLGDGTLFNSILSGGDFIDDASEDFQFNYSNNRVNPDSRNWKYADHYEVGDGVYMSNYYMWLLRSEKASVDPRTRYYFFRKVDDAVNQDATTFSCHFGAAYDPTAIPSYYTSVDPNMPFCIAETDGYSGRDHLNGEGIPPDGPIRTSWGLYPAGGDFDADDFDDTRNNGTTGGLGAGIAPIMLSSYVHFMRAEAALHGLTTEDARAQMVAGIAASLAKVEGFEGLVSAKMGTSVTLRDGSTGTVKELYGMSAADKTDYAALAGGLYDAAGTDEERLAVVAKEYYIAAFGNGLEAYNMYRRTGYPDNIQPAIEAAPGPFPLSFFYPSNSTVRNSSIDQKDGLTTQVFWQANYADVVSRLY